jgi:hypothetical protein
MERNGNLRARGLGTYEVLDVDTVIFAIGDRVDEKLGLPIEQNEFSKSPAPRFPIDGNSYELYDPNTGEIIPDVFVAGWSRKASAGLVGVARRDGNLGARAVLKYLGNPAPFGAIRSGRSKITCASSTKWWWKSKICCDYMKLNAIKQPN